MSIGIEEEWIALRSRFAMVAIAMSARSRCLFCAHESTAECVLDIRHSGSESLQLAPGLFAPRQLSLFQVSVTVSSSLLDIPAAYARRDQSSNHPACRPHSRRPDPFVQADSCPVLALGPVRLHLARSDR